MPIIMLTASHRPSWGGTGCASFRGASICADSLIVAEGDSNPFTRSCGRVQMNRASYNLSEVLSEDYNLHGDSKAWRTQLKNSPKKPLAWSPRNSQTFCAA